MKRRIALLVSLFCFLAVSCSAPTKEAPANTETPLSASPTAAVSKSCTPTLDDGISPSYLPDTPVRNVVGHGHVITGTVRSSVDCSPIANAKLEFWPEVEGLGHPNSERATFFTDENGQYRFECNMPDHIHMRISAEGFRTIGVNSYHPDGAATGSLDIVLKPAQ